MSWVWSLALCDNEKVELLPQKPYWPANLWQKKLEDPWVLDQWFSKRGSQVGSIYITR